MMNAQDLLLALLLPLPPWLGFLIYRRRGRVGLSYGYFLGGILAVLSLPWPQIGGQALPSAHLGGALLGFTLFLQAHREGRPGLRRLGLGVGGSTLFAWIVGHLMGLDMHSVLAFWGTALLMAGLWLLLSDLGYRLTQGRWLSLRVPLVGGLAFLLSALPHHFLPLGPPPLHWSASLLAGLLLGLVALQQFVWLREQGTWVEGRGNSLRVALSALELAAPAEGPTLAFAIEARQAILLVGAKGRILEANTAFSRMVGLPRNHLRGYELQALFQGRELPVWQELKDQLLRESHARIPATLVRRDGSFAGVRLEAAPFDRDLALVWVADDAQGSLGLRGLSSALLDAAGQPQRHLAINALGSIGPAAEQILAETQDPRTRRAAELILLAAQRLSPEARRPESPLLEARPALEELLPRLGRLLPPEVSLDLEVPLPLALAVEPRTLHQAAMHLVLRHRSDLLRGTLRLRLRPLRLGGQTWAHLALSREGEAGGAPVAPLGLSWLQDELRGAGGMLLLEGEANPELHILLPASGPEEESAPDLAGQRIWIVDEDGLVREALAGLVRRAGGEPLGLPGMLALARALRAQAAPDLLVLERSPRALAQGRRLAALGLCPRALLLLDRDPGQLLQERALARRRAALGKPFQPQAFLDHLMALLHPLGSDTQEGGTPGIDLDEGGPRGRSAPSPSPLVLPHVVPGGTPGTPSDPNIREERHKA